MQFFASIGITKKVGLQACSFGVWTSKRLSTSLGCRVDARIETRPARSGVLGEPSVNLTELVEI